MTGKNSEGRKKEVMEKLAARIRAVRKQRGFSNYEKFANQHNLSRSQVGKYEKGQNMTIYSLVTLLDALDMSLGEFFSEGFEK